MHELSIVQSLVKMADYSARSNNAQKVKFIVFEVGGMTGVEPRYVREYYPEVCARTLLEGSEIRIEEVTPLVFCRECGNSYELPDDQHLSCPKCGAENYEVLEGNKLILKEIGFV